VCSKCLWSEYKACVVSESHCVVQWVKMASGKPQKSRRKISLPWFRQGSFTPPHQQLTRQHTIDTPGSFQVRLLQRQPSQSQVHVWTTSAVFRYKGNDSPFILRLLAVLWWFCACVVWSAEVLKLPINNLFDINKNVWCRRSCVDTSLTHCGWREVGAHFLRLSLT
jgi:hypothetical protein